MVNPNSKSDEVHNTFREFLSSKGLRITNQRLAIFDAAFQHEDHFTAEELLVAARAIDDTVSRATVYRALPILTESGLIREVDVGRDYKFYMANKNANTFKAQVICVETDKIFEIDAPFMEWYGKTVAEKLGMEVVSQRLQVMARCKDGHKLERDQDADRARENS
ncbi:MAG: Ferric uptake regulation protein [Opitutia bacterium UBA7350]|nr:MAG: Ferric uptake regulation protein [Opitutae bacterium UBA7350]